MWVDIMARVCGRAVAIPLEAAAFDSDAAELFGHVRWAVRDEEYPGLVQADGGGCTGASVRGVLYRGLSPQEFKRLDAFEGIEYERVMVRVRVWRNGENRIEGAQDGSFDSRLEEQAWVYRFREAFADRLLPTPWDPERFESEGKQRFMQRYVGFQVRSAT